MQFTTPAFFLVLIPGLLGLAWSWNKVFGLAKSRKVVVFAIRLILLVILVSALAGPQWVQRNVGTAVMFVIDRSDSIADMDKKFADDFVRDAISKLGTDDVAGVVAFGAQPVLDSAVGGRRTFSGIQSKVDGSASNLASAVRLAMATLPSGKGRRLVVLSDGNETQGDALEAAEVASTESLQIDFVSLGTNKRTQEASIVEMRTPSERSVNEPFEIRVVMESLEPQTATLVIDRDGVVVARQPVKLDQGRSTFTLDQKLTKPGFARYRATLEPSQDTDTRNNVGSSFVNVRGNSKVLVLQGDASKFELKNALQSQGLDVQLSGAEGIPNRPEELQQYDAVILNDINATFFNTPQMATLRSAVRDTGIGFAMIGGENSFLPGGWYGSPVAEILPVDLNIRQRKTYPSTSVLMIIDASGSMGAMEDGVQKIQLAAKAGEETVKLLSPIDRLSVCGSSDNIDAVAPMQELKDKEKVISQIKKLRPGMGGIYAEPSVQYAKKLMESEKSRVRHFIFVGDGADVDSYGESLRLVSEMNKEKITTSVIAIGDGKDVPFMKQMALVGGGKFYLALQASKLPSIFTQDVAVMSRSAIEEVTFVPEIRYGVEAVKGFSPGEFPALFAYCLTDARSLARVGMVSPKKDPILATWQFGLGSSLAFMSDAQSRWAGRWVPWEGFGRFWAQSVRSIFRKSTTNDYQIQVDHEGGKGVVQLKATDKLGRPIESSTMNVKVASPNGDPVDVQLTQEAPGSFSGTFPVTELGSYIVSVAEDAPNGQTRVFASGFSVPYPPEYRSYRTNNALLKTMAEATSGKAIDSPADSLRTIPVSGQSMTELWSRFLILALILLPFDVALRRLAIPLSEIFNIFNRKSKAPSDSSATATLQRLNTARMSTEFARAKEAPTNIPKDVEGPKAPPAETPRSPAPTTHVSAASRLLEERRKRRGEK